MASNVYKDCEHIDNDIIDIHDIDKHNHANATILNEYNQNHITTLIPENMP